MDLHASQIQGFFDIPVDKYVSSSLARLVAARAQTREKFQSRHANSCSPAACVNRLKRHFIGKGIQLTFLFRTALRRADNAAVPAGNDG